jgi:fucose permease
MTATTIERRTDTLVIGIAFIAFIGLGLTAGLLGVAWPSIRTDFGLQLDAIGTLLLGSTIGYITGSFFSVRLIARFGSGQAFAAATTLIAVSYLLMIVAPSWEAIVLLSYVGGLGGGTVDAGLNWYLATYGTARQMNWLHACFGIGLTVGPLLMTAVVVNGLPWRLGYGIAGGLVVLITVLIGLTLKDWRNGIPVAEGEKPKRQASISSTLRQPLVWLSLLLFFVYCGLEIGVSNWTFTWFTEGRHVPEDMAGFWVSVYAGSFTIGRILFGIISERAPVLLSLRLCMLGSIVGAALLWLNFSEAVGFFGLALLGFAQAPLFPLMTLRTAERVGAEYAANTIGFQVSAAGVGIAVLPWLQGILAKQIGLEVLGPIFFVFAVLVVVIHEATLVWHPTAQQVKGVAVGD